MKLNSNWAVTLTQSKFVSAGGFSNGADTSSPQKQTNKLILIICCFIASLSDVVQDMLALRNEVQFSEILLVVLLLLFKMLFKTFLLCVMK